MDDFTDDQPTQDQPAPDQPVQDQPAQQAPPAPGKTWTDDIPEAKRPPQIPPWEEVQKHFKDLAPDLDQDKIKEQYEQQRRLGNARRTARLKGDETLPEYIGHRSIPFGSVVQNTGEALDYGAALKRLREGQGEDADFRTVAEHEHRQDIEKNRSLGGKIVSGLAHIPAIAGEFMAGSALAKGGAEALRAGGWLAPKAAEAAVTQVPQFLSLEALKTAGKALVSPSGLAKSAALTPLVPSMYVERWMQGNLQNGRDPMDLRGLPPAYAMGVLQVHVLGAAGQMAGTIPGSTAAAWAGRLGVGTATGIAGQQGVDVSASLVSHLLPKAYKLETGYGLLGDLASGKLGEAGEHFVVQAVTFAAFSALHAHNDAAGIAETQRYAETMRAMARRGVSAPRAGALVNQAYDALAGVLRNNPDPTRAQVEKAMGKLPEGPVRDHGLGMAKQFPEVAQPSGEQGGAHLPEPAAAEAAKAEKTPETNLPPEEDIRGVARHLGLKHTGPIEDVIGRVTKAGGKDFLDALSRPDTGSLRVTDHPELNRPAPEQPSGEQGGAHLPEVTPKEGVETEIVRPHIPEGADLLGAIEQPRMPGHDVTAQAEQTPEYQRAVADAAAAGAPKPPPPAPSSGTPLPTWKHTGTKFGETASGEVEFTGKKDGKKYRIEGSLDEGRGNILVRVLDANGDEVGRTLFDKKEDGNDFYSAAHTQVAEGSRRLGLAEAMYDFAHEQMRELAGKGDPHGGLIVPSTARTADAKGLWAKNSGRADLPRGKTPLSAEEAAMTPAEAKKAADRLLKGAESEIDPIREDLERGIDEAGDLQPEESSALKALLRANSLREAAEALPPVRQGKAHPSHEWVRRHANRALGKLKQSDPERWADTEITEDGFQRLREGRSTQEAYGKAGLGAEGLAENAVGQTAEQVGDLHELIFLAPPGEAPDVFVANLLARAEETARRQGLSADAFLNRLMRDPQLIHNFLEDYRSERATTQRGPEQPAAVRPENGPALHRGRAGAETPVTPETTQGDAPKSPQTGTAPGRGGEAPGNELTGKKGLKPEVHWTKEAQTVGIDPADLKAAVRDIRQQDREYVQQHNEIHQEVSRELGPLANLIREKGRYPDADSVPGLDEIAQKVERIYPGLFSEAELPTDTVFRMLKRGPLKPMTEDAAWSKAFHRLYSAKPPESTWQPDLYGQGAKSVASQKPLFEAEAPPAREKPVDPRQQELPAEPPAADRPGSRMTASERADFLGDVVDAMRGRTPEGRHPDQASVRAEAERRLEGLTGKKARQAAILSAENEWYIQGRIATIAPPRPGEASEEGLVDRGPEEVEPGVNFNIPSGGRMPRPPGTPPGRPAAQTPPPTTPPPRTILGALRALLSPASRSPEAAQAAGVMRENLAEMARQGDLAREALTQARKHFDDWIGAEQDPAAKTNKFLEFADAIEEGKIPTLPPELRPFAETIRRLQDERTRQLTDRGLLNNFIDNYFGHIWKDPRGGTPEGNAALFQGRRPLAGSEGYRKRRTIPTYREGIELGLEPVSWNPAELALAKFREIDKSIMGRDVFNELKEKGLAKFFRLGERPPQGWREFSDRMGRVFAPPEVEVKEFFDKQQTEGLENFARSLGLNLRRVMTGPAGMHRPGEITTRFATPEENLAHEIGHELDYRYHLRDWLRDPDLHKELSDLADLRASGRPDPAMQAYLRSEPEMLANLVAARLHAPELLQQIAPKSAARLEALLSSKPELQPLLDVKPSLEMGERAQMLRLAGPMLVGKYYLPETVQGLLENYLAPGLQGNPLYDAFRGAGNMLNQFQLGFSAFHAGFVLMDTQMSAFALGLKQISRGDFSKGLGNLALGTVPGLAPFRTYLRGSKVLAEYYQPGSQGAETAAVVDALIKGGGRARMDSFYRNNQIEAFRTALREGRPLGVIGRALPALAEALSQPIMEHLVPRMKLGVFADLARDALGRMPPNADPAQAREVMGKAWDSVENRLGQLTYDNLFWNKTFKDSLMAGVRSVGWNIGTWRELGGGVLDTKKSLGGLGSKGVTDRLAYLLALPAVTAIYGAMYQYLATGKGPDETKDYFFPKTGRTRKDGTADRVSLPSYMRDVAALTNRADEGPVRTLGNAWTMAKHKSSPIINLISEMLSNEDYYGAAIRNPNDPQTRQVADMVKHLLGSFESFSVRALRQQRETGGGYAAQAQGFFGVTPAPAYVTRTSEQQRLMEAQRKRTLTPLEKKRQGERK